MKNFNNVFKQITKGALIYIILSILEIILFSLILQAVSLSDITIKIINQVFKILFIFLSCLISVKGKKGILQGAILGLISAILLYVIFLIFKINTFSLKNFILEIIFLSIIGGICGIIAVNKKSV